MLLDSGSKYTLLSQETADKITYLKDNEQPAQGCSVKGCKDGFFTSTVRKLCVGDDCLDNVEVKYPVWDALGMSFLGKYKTTVKMETGCLELNK
jgi:hypothetical protein